MKKTNLKKQKVLIIEDNLFLRKIYKNKLISAGFELSEATDGNEGINKAVVEKPDIILLDLILPKKSGFDVLIEMKKNKKTKEIPVIILSILGQELDVKKGLSFGAVDYLIKSKVSLSEVVNKVKTHLKK